MEQIQPVLTLVSHDSELSGAPRLLTHLGEELEDEGYSIQYLLPSAGDLAAELKAQDKSIKIIGNLPVGLSDPVDWQVKVRIILSRAKALADYYRYFKSQQSPIVWLGSAVAVIPLLAAWLAGKKVVVSVQETPTDSFAWKVRRFLLKRFAHALFFVSKPSRRFFAPQPKMQTWQLFPNWTDRTRRNEIERCHARRTENLALRQGLGAASSDIVFMCVAYVSLRKGIDILLAGFAELRQKHSEAKLWIVGGESDSNREFVERMHRIAKQGSLKDAVRFLGMRNDIPNLLASSDVYVLPSRNEGLPLSIVEAMDSAKPVIATDVGSVADQVKDGVTGRLIPSEDPEALAEAMAYYCEHPEARRRHGQAGKRRSAALFSAERAREKAVNLLRKLT